MKTDLNKIKEGISRQIPEYISRDGVVKLLEHYGVELLAFDIPYYLKNTHGIVADELMCSVLNHFIRKVILKDG